jgi:hypothetical protein
MIKCPFCHFDNEDGALFCERCTSDLTGVAASAPPPPPIPSRPAPPPPPPLVEAIPLEAVPLEAVPLDAIPFAMAEPIDAFPMATAAPMDLIPVAPAPVPAPVVVPPVIPPTPAPVPTPATTHPATSEVIGGGLPAGAQPRLLVLRGQKRNVEYPIYEGLNFVGRADEKPVDIDLEEQEPPDRVWCSRQHACISLEDNQLAIEDLNSANGTYVNRSRVYPGAKKALAVNDILQIGNVQMKIII